MSVTKYIDLGAVGSGHAGTIGDKWSVADWIAYGENGIMETYNYIVTGTNSSPFTKNFGIFAAPPMEDDGNSFNLVALDPSNPPIFNNATLNVLSGDGANNFGEVSGIKLVNCIMTDLSGGSAVIPTFKNCHFSGKSSGSYLDLDYRREFLIDSCSFFATGTTLKHINWSDHGASGQIVNNCIFEGGACAIYNLGGNPTYSYNSFYNMGTSDIIDDGGTCIDGGNNSDDARSQFINGGADDLHLITNADACNTGNTALTVDLEGTARPQNANDSKGCYDALLVAGGAIPVFMNSYRQRV